MSREKEAILKVVSLENGGFWNSTKAVIRIIERTKVGEREMGDFLLSSGTHSTLRKLRDMKEEYEENGWTLLGDWDF